MQSSLALLPWYHQAGALIALAAGAALAFHYYYEVPLTADVTAREIQLALFRSDISESAQVAGRITELRASVDDLEIRLKDLRGALPEERDLAELLRRMQGDALQSDLTIRSIGPARVVTRELHAEWSIELELEGTYHNLAAFFDRLAGFSRIVNITSLEVVGKDKPDPDTTITARCVATTFVLLADPSMNQTTSPPSVEP